MDNNRNRGNFYAEDFWDKDGYEDESIDSCMANNIGSNVYMTSDECLASTIGSNYEKIEEAIKRIQKYIKKE